MTDLAIQTKLSINGNFVNAADGATIKDLNPPDNSKIADVAFGVNWTAFTIFIVLIGGIGTVEGPILGALIFWLLNKFFSDYGSWYLIGLGLLAIVIVVKLRAGLWDAISKRFDLHLFPVQRRLKLREK